MKKLRSAFAAAVLGAAVVAAAPVHAGGFDFMTIFNDMIGRQNDALTTADLHLQQAVENNDPASAERALRAGARPNLPETANGYMGIERNPLGLAVDSFYRLSPRGTPQDAYDVITILLENGALPTAKVLQKAVNRLPAGGGQGLDAQMVDTLFARADKTFTPADYTAVLSGGAAAFACDAAKLQLVLDRGADANDTQHLLQYFPAAPDSLMGATISYGALPLHYCLKNILLNPDSPEMRDAMVRGANILLGNGARASALLNAPSDLYSQSHDSARAVKEFGRLPAYEVTAEERALLTDILSRRKPAPWALPRP